MIRNLLCMIIIFLYRGFGYVSAKHDAQSPKTFNIIQLPLSFIANNALFSYKNDSTGYVKRICCLVLTIALPPILSILNFTLKFTPIG